MPTDDNPYAAPQSHGPPPGEASTKKAHTELKESGRAWLIVMTLGGSLIGQWLFSAAGMPGDAETLRIVGFIFGSFAGACAFLMLWYSRSRPNENELHTDVVDEQSVEPAVQRDNPAPR